MCNSVSVRGTAHLSGGRTHAQHLGNMLHRHNTHNTRTRLLPLFVTHEIIEVESVYHPCMFIL